MDFLYLLFNDMFVPFLTGAVIMGLSKKQKPIFSVLLVMCGIGVVYAVTRAYVNPYPLFGYRVLALKHREVLALIIFLASVVLMLPAAVIRLLVIRKAVPVWLAGGFLLLLLLAMHRNLIRLDISAVVTAWFFVLIVDNKTQ